MSLLGDFHVHYCYALFKGIIILVKKKIFRSRVEDENREKTLNSAFTRCWCSVYLIFNRRQRGFFKEPLKCFLRCLGPD